MLLPTDSAAPLRTHQLSARRNSERAVDRHADPLDYAALRLVRVADFFAGRRRDTSLTSTALMRSRRKIQLNVRVTDVVPAPEEPVTAMMGCLADIENP